MREKNLKKKNDSFSFSFSDEQCLLDAVWYCTNLTHFFCWFIESDVYTFCVFLSKFFVLGLMQMF